MTLTGNRILFATRIELLSEADDWITINGTHVQIGDDGTIEKGPDKFLGMKPSDLNKKSSGKVKSRIRRLETLASTLKNDLDSIKAPPGYGSTDPEVYKALSQEYKAFNEKASLLLKSAIEAGARELAASITSVIKDSDAKIEDADIRAMDPGSGIRLTKLNASLNNLREDTKFLRQSTVKDREEALKLKERTDSLMQEASSVMDSYAHLDSQNDGKVPGISKRVEQVAKSAAELRDLSAKVVAHTTPTNLATSVTSLREMTPSVGDSISRLESTTDPRTLDGVILSSETSFKEYGINVHKMTILNGRKGDENSEYADREMKQFMFDYESNLHTYNKAIQSAQLRSYRLWGKNNPRFIGLNRNLANGRIGNVEPEEFQYKDRSSDQLPQKHWISGVETSSKKQEFNL